MRLILIGGPASGKTTVGQLLAKQWQCAFVDTDHVVEGKAGMPISQIFAEQGEAAFRDLETGALLEVLASSSCLKYDNKYQE